MIVLIVNFILNIDIFIFWQIQHKSIYFVKTVERNPQFTEFLKFNLEKHSGLNFKLFLSPVFMHFKKTFLHVTNRRGHCNGHIKTNLIGKLK